MEAHVSLWCHAGTNTDTLSVLATCIILYASEVYAVICFLSQSCVVFHVEFMAHTFSLV